MYYLNSRMCVSLLKDGKMINIKLTYDKIKKSTTHNKTLNRFEFQNTIVETMNSKKRNINNNF